MRVTNERNGMESITLGSHCPVVGDVLELPTRNGPRHAQYTHHDPEFGALLRVIDRAYSERPSDLNKVVREPAAFVTFFPLAAHRTRRSSNRSVI